MTHFEKLLFFHRGNLNAPEDVPLEHISDDEWSSDNE